MIYALISDIHANFDALEAVLAEIDDLKPDQILCLGDIVGYGAEPSRCMEAILEREIPCVAGNHDLAVADVLSTQYFNQMAQDSVVWTRGKLNPQEMDFLRSMPLQRDVDSFTIAHGALRDPAAFDYIMTIPDAIASFAAMERDWGFTAHSHVPISFVCSGRDVTACMSDSMHLAEADRCIINVGSVGQPRDSNPMAAYAVFDADKQEVSINRVAYDTELAARRILEAGLPSVNAYRLLLGR